jgi:chemotaxis signal transduction protein
MPGRLVLGVVPIADAEGIEHVEVVVDLAFALGLSNEGVQRDKKSCILIYENDDIVVGLAVDALVQRVSFAPPAGSIDLPFTTGLILDGDSAPDRHAEWRVIDVDALMRHVARELKVPMHA